MIELDEKYVFHIPLYKYVGEELVEIEIDDILDDLICQLHKNGFDSLYVTEIESYYKTRHYDEKLITIFSSGKSPVKTFDRWFRQNNDVLLQEAFAYEIGNKMFICEL